MKKVWLSSLLLLEILSDLNCHAQNKDSIRTQLSISLQGSYVQELTTRGIFPLRSYYSIESRKIAWRQSNYYIFGLLNDQQRENEFFNRTEMIISPRKFIYPLAVGVYEFSAIRNISHRTFFGAGLGVDLIKSKIQSLSLNTVLAHEQTGFVKMDGYETTRLTFRISGKHSLQNGHLFISHDSFINFSVEGNNNFRCRQVISLNFPIHKGLAFGISSDYSYEEVIEPGSRNNYWQATVGLNYSR